MIRPSAGGTFSRHAAQGPQWRVAGRAVAWQLGGKELVLLKARDFEDYLRLFSLAALVIGFAPQLVGSRDA